MAPYPNQPVSDSDPFADAEKVPALSFRDAPIGTVYQGTITKLPRVMQQRDFKTKEPTVWKDGNPKLVVVLHMEVTLAGGEVETRSVWANNPSSLFRALAKAQKDSGAQFAVGGTLAIRFAGTEPAKDPTLNPQKIYEARYTPPVVTNAWDPSPAAAAPGGAGQLCEEAAAPEGPRAAQPNGQCGNMAVTMVQGRRCCALHKARHEALMTTGMVTPAQAMLPGTPAPIRW